MKKVMVLAVLIVALVAIVPANAQDNKFKIYAAVSFVSPQGSSDITIEDVQERIEGASEAGWNVGFEWRFGKWAGLEFDYLNADQDLEIAGETVAATSMSPLSASFNFHLVHTKILDFYFGPTVSYYTWDDIKIGGEPDVSTDSEWGYGAQVGADFSIFKTVAIVTGIRYQQVDISADGESISINPLFAKAGVAFRW
jgi:outer membrane protein W